MERYRWKGKLVTKKVFLKKQKLSQRHSSEQTTEPGEDTAPYTPPPRTPNPSTPTTSTPETPESELGSLDGRRIVEISELGKNLKCDECKEILSLQNVEGESRRGLGSILMVRCHSCLAVTPVPTGKMHKYEGGRQRFDINSKVAIGCLHAGMGWTHLNKLLACLNVPPISFNTFKRHEREVGPAIESVARGSCEEAAAMERELTLKNKSTLEKLLPENLKDGFLTPATSSVRDNDTSEEGGNLSPFSPQLTLSSEPTVTFFDVIRIMISYDMGWSRRGSGRQYDSLNGFAAFIGAFSKKILDFETCNRKCKKCDMGRDPSDHDCRLNFWGSAKAMEPHAARKMVSDSKILKDKNMQVGIIVGDDDSSTIASCREACSHPLVKLSDDNHTVGGVRNVLHKMESNHGEMTGEAIQFLYRCFSYAMAQNKGNSEAMARAIESIPYHAFNRHEKCGDWCGYKQDPENYEHTSVPGGFRDPKLFQDLKDVFSKLAKNAQKFSGSVSSNANESLNATMASKAPKARCYSMSESADFRFACAVGQKNVGEGYTQSAAGKVGLSPGGNHTKHVRFTDRRNARRSLIINTPKFKKNRIKLKKLRNALRHRREDMEGVTYERSVGLLSQDIYEPEPSEDPDDPMEPGVNADTHTDNDTGIPIVFFDLETSGLAITDEILQIGAACQRSTFNMYIKPTLPINPSASKANGLIWKQGDLMYGGVIVPAQPLRIVLANFHSFLGSFESKCILAAHNLNFDGPRLFNAFEKVGLKEEFSEVVLGFADTLQIIRNFTKRKGKGACSVSGLASWLDISADGAHNALRDVEILIKIISKMKLPYDTIRENQISWLDSEEKWEANERARSGVKEFGDLAASADIKKKMFSAGITLEELKNSYAAGGKHGVAELLSKRVNGKPQVTKHTGCIQKIVDWLRINP